MESFEKQVVNAVESSQSGSWGWRLLELAGVGVSVLSLPAGLIIGATAIVADTVQQRRSLRDERMPDEWLEAVAEAPSVSSEGLTWLAQALKRQGFVSAADASEFLDIERRAAEQLKKQNDAARTTALSGAQKLLTRASIQCRDSVDITPEFIKTAAKFVGQTTTAGARVAVRLLGKKD